MYIYEGILENTNASKDTNLLYSLTRKQMASGKQGEAGIKMISGSFVCSMDSIAEALKILEEGIKTSKLGNVKIGISCNASELFNESSGKYEMEGAKSQFDPSQMVEFYVKFLTEHPLVCYLEDPMADKDLPGWHELTVIEIFRKYIGKNKSRETRC